MAKAQEGDSPKATTTQKVVKYVGTADQRVIEAKDWKSVGVEDQGKVVWDQKNKFTVPASELNEGALRYADEDDSGLVVTEQG